MSEQEVKKQGSKKKVILIVLVAVLIILVGVLVIILGINREKVYRVLKVYAAEGECWVDRENTGKLDPYVNMNLESGDRIGLVDGSFTIRADEDKYIYLDDHTELRLEADGDAKNSRTKIELITGGITNDIQNKLSMDSSYEINTPNSTMSVLGTIYYVKVYEENNVTYTKVAVFQGSVATRLVYGDKTVSQTVVAVPDGKEVLIYDDGQKTDYVSEPTDIDYHELPEEVLRYLGDVDSEDRQVSITKEEVNQILEGPYTVTFMYGDHEFGRQTVMKGKKATVPVLSPEPEGEWEFDFNEEIDRDIVVKWKSK